MGSVKCNSKTRIVVSIQYFDGKGMPDTILETYEAPSGMSTEAMFNLAITKVREQKKFIKKPEIHRHD